MTDDQWVDSAPSIDHLKITFDTLTALSQNYESLGDGWCSLVEGKRMVGVETRALYGDAAWRQVTGLDEENDE